MITETIENRAPIKSIAMTKVWKLKHYNEGYATQLEETLKIHPAICKLLAIRGIDSYQRAKDFFRPSLDHLHNPYLMLGMEQAVGRILQAVEQKEKIVVYGDYDVDGTTAVAVVYSFLSKNFENLEISYYVPHRYREGYGISTEGIDSAAEKGVSLIITLDCGIKSVEKVDYAASKGIDVIICDHHMPDENNIPKAYAILNPKQQDCGYPYKELSGCGIGFKLICALATKVGLPFETVEKYLDLVATSIAADIVPMDDENRVLAFYGMQRANQNPCLALKTIKEVAGVNRSFTISDLVFVVAPRINAAGRMDDARKAIELFVEENPERSKELTLELHADNFDRKEVDKSMTDEALNILANDVMVGSTKSTILFRAHWHKGVVGIVASRLIDHYYKPTIVLTESNGKVTGSARSVIGFNIYDAIHQCSELLENYGGHYFAAGMTMAPANLQAFSQKFEQIVSDNITPNSLQPVIDIDVAINIEDITPGFFNIIRQFEPFGPTNLKPVFISRGVKDHKGFSRVVKEMHIRFVIEQGAGNTISGIGFGLADKFEIMTDGKPFDVIYTIEENEWKGNKSLQMKVIDLRPSGQ